MYLKKQLAEDAQKEVGVRLLGKLSQTIQRKHRLVLSLKYCMECRSRVAYT